MSGLEACGAAAAVGVVHLTATEGIAFLLAGLVIGILLAFGLHRWLEEGDRQIAEALRAAEDESLAIAVEVTAPYSGGRIPTQRVTNGEDLLYTGPDPIEGGDQL